MDQKTNPALPRAAVKGIVNERESQLRLVTTVRLRWAAVLGQLAAVGITVLYFGFTLDVSSCLILIAMSAWLNVFLSIRYPARHRLSTTFAMGLLLFDVFQLCALLYLTGGIENPFVLLLVAPVTVASAALPPRYAVVMGLIVMASAVFLITNHEPLPWYPNIGLTLPRDYKVGILAALAATMSFAAFYTWRLNKESRQMSAALAATDMVLASEQRLHALDGLAAAAAHELGTPLSTIVLVAKELEHELGKDSRYIEDLQLLHSQARRCRDILQKLTRKPDEQDPMHASVTVREVIEEAALPHRNSGKRIVVSGTALPGTAAEAAEEPVSQRQPGIIYGLGNLIENAVSYAAREVHADARWNEANIILTITDDGPGFKPELMDSIGEPYITSRRLEDRGDKGHSGLGLGFFIAKTLLERSGATVNFSNRAAPQTGAIVQVSWARQALELRSDAFDWQGRRVAARPAAE